MGNVLDMMVNLVSNMVDNWGGGNGNGSSVDNWGGVSNSNWSCMRISGNWGSMSNGGDSWSGNGMASRVDTSDKTVSNSSSYKTMPIGSSNKTMSQEVLSISISNWGSKATANKSREDNKALHLDQC